MINPNPMSFEEKARERGCVTLSHPKKETHFLVWNRVGKDWYLQTGGALTTGRQRGRRVYDKNEPKIYWVVNFTNQIQLYQKQGYTAS